MQSFLVTRVSPPSKVHEYMHNSKGMNLLFHDTDRVDTHLSERQGFFLSLE